MISSRNGSSGSGMATSPAGVVYVAPDGSTGSLYTVDPLTGVVTSGSGSMSFTERGRKSFDWTTVVDGVETARVEGSSQRE